MVNFDMIGRSLLGDLRRHTSFCSGTERIAGVRPVDRGGERRPRRNLSRWRWWGRTSSASTGAITGRSGCRKVPYLFFSTGENPAYHRPSDVAATIQYPKFAAIYRLIFGVVRRAVDADSIPAWSDVPDYPPGEAASLRDVFKILEAHREEIGLKGLSLTLMRNCLRTLDAIVARGKITSAERSGVLRVAQFVLFSVT